MLQLERVKVHARVDDGSEDELLGAYSAAAWEAVANFIDRPLYATEQELAADALASPHAMVVTPALEHAMLLLIGHWYVNREAIVIGGSGAGGAEVPMAARFLMTPYRRFKVGDDPPVTS